MPNTSRPNDLATAIVPRWLHDSRELRLAGVLLKEFRKPSPSQIAVLEALEEEDWRGSVDDPLPPSHTDRHDRLRDVVRRLNRQTCPLIVFFRDGTGDGIGWHWAPVDVLQQHLPPEVIARLSPHVGHAPPVRPRKNA